MCAECDTHADALSTVVDVLCERERSTRKMHGQRESHGSLSVRLASDILDAHQDDQGRMSTSDVRRLAHGYAVCVQKLSALQELSGLS